MRYRNDNILRIIRREDESMVKQLTFNDDEVHVPGPYTKLRSSVLKREIEFYRKAKINIDHQTIYSAVKHF